METPTNDHGMINLINDTSGNREIVLTPQSTSDYEVNASQTTNAVTIDVSNSLPTQAVTVMGGTGNDTFIGGIGVNTFIGDSTPDSQAVDTFVSQGGVDKLIGGTGTNVFNLNLGTDPDVVANGKVNAIDLSSTGFAVKLDFSLNAGQSQTVASGVTVALTGISRRLLEPTTAIPSREEQDPRSFAEGAEPASFSSAEAAPTRSIPGRPMATRPPSWADPAATCSLAETVTTRSWRIGSTTIMGGSGSDLLFGGDGPTTITGGSGPTTIMGGSGSDLLFGAWATTRSFPARWWGCPRPTPRSWEVRGATFSSAARAATPFIPGRWPGGATPWSVVPEATSSSVVLATTRFRPGTGAETRPFRPGRVRTRSWADPAAIFCSAV